MKSYHNFNDVSQELLNTVPKLKVGQKVTFQMLTGINIQDAESGENTIAYGKVQIPMKDRIKDPFTGKTHSIGIVEEYDLATKEPTKYKFFMPGQGEQHFHGNFTLVGGNVDDEEMLEFFWLCNYNRENKNRDTSIHALFYPIDEVAISNKIEREANVLRDALNVVTELDAHSIKSIADSLNFPEMFDAKVLKSNVTTWAMENPEDFLKLYADPTTMVKADVKRAIDKGMLTYDPAGHRILWTKGNAVIATFDRVEGADHLSQMAEWCLTAKNGNDVLKNIRKRLKENVLQAEETE